ncbi:hypothetical protein HZA57_03110, partial [Candidatus Poribacteria bacterium]|nr:hypothetical protein [Candidatus Poribacteria bacterium]
VDPEAALEELDKLETALAAGRSAGELREEYAETEAEESEEEEEETECDEDEDLEGIGDPNKPW